MPSGYINILQRKYWARLDPRRGKGLINVPSHDDNGHHYSTSIHDDDGDADDGDGGDGDDGDDGARFQKQKYAKLVFWWCDAARDQMYNHFISQVVHRYCLARNLCLADTYTHVGWHGTTHQVGQIMGCPKLCVWRTHPVFILELPKIYDGSLSICGGGCQIVCVEVSSD